MRATAVNATVVPVTVATKASATLICSVSVKKNNIHFFSVTKIECNYLFDICQVSDPPPLKSSCTPDWTGERCETRATACEDRCQNGGSCIQTASGTSCSCPSGFSGEFCENCPSLNCLHGAFCRAIEKETKNKEKENRDKNSENDKERKFVCSCPPGFSGDRCERSECDDYCPQVTSF
jgi:hypothetical protein